MAVTPAVITIDNPTGQVRKGEEYPFSFSITPPLETDHVETYTVTSEGELEDGKVFSVSIDLSKFIKVSKIEVT